MNNIWAPRFRHGIGIIFEGFAKLHVGGGDGFNGRATGLLKEGKDQREVLRLIDGG